MLPAQACPLTGAAEHLNCCRRPCTLRPFSNCKLQDVPGVAYGTIPNRADGTLLKIIPKSEQPGSGGHTKPHSKRAGLLKSTAAAASVVPLAYAQPSMPLCCHLQASRKRRSSRRRCWPARA